MDNYWIIRALFGRDTAQKYLGFEIFLGVIIGLFALVVAAIGGVVYLATCLWNQLDTLIQFRMKYGDSWRTEFEHYHGSLAHAEARLLIVFLCIAALAGILGWISRRIYYFRKSH